MPAASADAVEEFGAISFGKIGNPPPSSSSSSSSLPTLPNLLVSTYLKVDISKNRCARLFIHFLLFIDYSILISSFILTFRRN